MKVFLVSMFLLTGCAATSTALVNQLVEDMQVQKALCQNTLQQNQAAIGQYQTALKACESKPRAAKKEEKK